jgi:hypothetical protein
MDSTLEDIAGEKTISLDSAWTVMQTIVEASKAFSDLHDQEKQEHMDALEAEAAADAYHSERDPYD